MIDNLPKRVRHEIRSRAFHAGIGAADPSIWEVLKNGGYIAARYDPDNFLIESDAFFRSPSEQLKFFKDNGYYKVNDGNYGLADHAAHRLRNLYKIEVPIYQKGNDQISRDSLIAIGNYKGYSYFDRYLNRNKLRDEANHTGTIYKHIRLPKYYTRAWDLNDVGSYDNEGGYVLKGFWQKAARFMDKYGHPFAVRTGITYSPRLRWIIRRRCTGSS